MDTFEQNLSKGWLKSGQRRLKELEHRIEALVDKMGAPAADSELDDAIAEYDRLAIALQQIRAKGISQFLDEQQRAGGADFDDSRRSNSESRGRMARTHLRSEKESQEAHQKRDPAILKETGATTGLRPTRSDLLFPADSGESS